MFIERQNTVNDSWQWYIKKKSLSDIFCFTKLNNRLIRRLFKNLLYKNKFYLLRSLTGFSYFRNRQSWGVGSNNAMFWNMLKRNTIIILYCSVKWNKQFIVKKTQLIIIHDHFHIVYMNKWPLISNQIDMYAYI